MALAKEQNTIISSLVGDFTQTQLSNLQENLESYIHPKLSVFIPIYKYCEYAVSPNHKHPGYSFIYTMNSSGGHFLIEGETIEFPRSKSSFICAFSPELAHQEVIEEGFSNYFALFLQKKFFESEIQKYTCVLPHFRGVCFSGNESLLFLIKMYLQEFSSRKSNSETVKEAYITLITNKLIAICLGFEEENVSFTNQEKIDAAIGYLYQHIDRKITIDQLAEQADLSASHFTKLFKDVTGNTPIEYLKDVRLEKAKRLLKLSKLNLTEIAFECGFTSSSYFSYCFIEKHKLTPSEYRKKFSKS